MRIAYVAPSTLPSETANSVQVMKVCQALTQLGNEVHLLVPAGRPTSFADLQRHYGVSTEFQITWMKASPSLRKLDFAWNAVSAARRQHADLVYTRLVWVALIALKRGLPVILEMHELPGGRFSPWLYQRYVTSSGQKLTVFITRALQQLIEANLHLQHSDAESCIAPDGVDLERFSDLPEPAVARKTLGLQEKITALYSGGFFPGRGIENLYELAKKFPEVQFIWIGGKPAQVSEWQQKLSAAGLNNVTLTGYVANSQLPLYQAAADVLLMPYQRKVAGHSGGDIAQVTSPMKLFEYLASGRAILTADLPVLREVLSESNAAFYAPDDLDAFFSQFDQLVRDPALRHRLADTARQDARSYAWKERMQIILNKFSLQNGAKK
ncbi:MAG: glycosyltransferase [Anaerolineaceae bacterium]|nr:glycosyltransferase [Anaerolineaceae bacterium]